MIAKEKEEPSTEWRSVWRKGAAQTYENRFIQGQPRRKLKCPGNYCQTDSL